MYRFKECREAARISQKAAAISLGVSAPSMSAWENGKNGPTIENLVAMAKLYGVSTDDLLGVSTVKGVLGYDESVLLQVFRQLTPESRSVLMATATALLQQPGMRQETPTASVV